MSDAPPAVASAGSSADVGPASRRELRYEGFPLEAVLARVHAAHGADVTITSADRVRRGGIGGFFARELFQVTVVVPLEAEPNFVPIGQFSIFGDDQLAVIGDEPDEDAASVGTADHDRFDYDRSDHVGRDYDEIDPEDIAGAMALAPAPQRDDADQEIWALLAAAATASPRSTAPPAPPGIDAASIASVAPTPVSSAPVAPPAVPAASLAAEVVAPIRSSGPIASTTLIPASSVVGTPFDPALCVRTSLAASPEAHSVGAGSIRSSVPLGAPAVPAVPALPVVEAVEAVEAIDLSRLLADFDRVTPAPALPTAGIVAVVGGRTEALAVAGSVAARLGIPTDDVIVAAPPPDVVVPTAEEAMRLAATTRYRCAPVAVIVLELVPGRQGHEWVRVVLDGLRAEQVRLAADTCGLLAHQHLSISAVGGVDVIDLLDATAHPAPADALALPTPVGTIDGRPATAELWAATQLAGRQNAIRPRTGIGAATVDRSNTGGR